MKRSIPVLALMSVSVALLAASASFSFAWYASGATLYVESIRIEADPDRLLTISTEKEGEYKSDLRKDDLHSVGLFTPVTMAYDSTWVGEEEPILYDMSHHYGLSGDPVLFKASPDGYFSQEVYLKCDDDVIAGVDIEATSILPDEKANADYAKVLTRDEGLAEGDELFSSRASEWKARLDAVKDCGRVSLYVDGKNFVVDPNANEEGDVLYGGALDNDNDRYFDFYQNPDDGLFYETCYGELLDGHSREELVYLPPLEQDSPLLGEPSAFNARHKAGVHRLDLDSNAAILRKEGRLTSKELTAQLEMPALAFELNAYEPKRVVVSFFLEGWDRDSINGAMGASFLLNLSLRIIRER